MKFINRSAVNIPSCLDKYTQKNEWRDLVNNASDYEELIDSLFKIQGFYCAYCERRLFQEKRGSYHIDHFVSRASDRRRTFDWENLFLCCSDIGNKFCAKYKDSEKNPYRDKEIVKPDEINPRSCFSYDYDSGKVVIRVGCENQQIAQNTIDRLNLNCEKLTGMRRSVIKLFDNLLAGSYVNDKDIQTNDVDETISLIVKELNKQKGFASLLEAYISERQRED